MFKLKIITVAILLLTNISALAAQNENKTKTKIDRGIKMQSFMPKGTFISGATLGYSSIEADDYGFLVLDNMTIQGAMTNAAAFFGYTFSENVAAGVAVKYSRTRAQIDQLDFELSDDMTFGVNDYFNIQHTFVATAFLRTYISIGKQKRIGLYNDVEVYFGGGQGKNSSGKGQVYTGTYQEITKMGLLISPGITVFATDFMAVEAGISIFGIEYFRTEQISNQVYLGSIETFTASFKLNLLKVSLGLAFYF